MRTRRFTITALLAAITVVLTAACGASVPPPLDRSVQPPIIGDRYRFVAAHPALAEQVACYCGCGEELSHRHLRDCFVRDDGTLDPHAADCGICQAEATLVEQWSGEGMTPPAIAARIDAQFAAVGQPTRPRAGAVR